MISSLWMVAPGCGDDDATDIPQDHWAYARQITDSSDLIEGPISRGEVGDYLIGNSRVRFVIQGYEHPRTLLPWGGTVIDADVVRAPGEDGQDRFQELGPIAGYLRVVRPTSIKVVSSGKNGKPAILRVIGVDAGMPLIDTILPLGTTELAVQTDYILEPDAISLRIETTYTSTSESGSSRSVKSGDALVMNDLLTLCTAPEPGCDVTDAPLHPDWITAHNGRNVSYAYFTTGEPVRVELQQDDLWLLTGPGFGLAPAEQGTFTRYLAVAADPEPLWPEVLERQGVQTLATISGQVQLDDGAPAAGAAVDLLTPDGDWITRVVADDDGLFSARTEPGALRLLASAGLRDASPITDVDASGGDVSDVELTLAEPAWAELDLRDDSNQPVPGRVDFYRGHDATPVGGGEYSLWSLDGTGRIELPPGQWTAAVTRGYEWDSDVVFITATAGQTATVQASIAHVVDTPGYLAIDTHTHTRYSIDSQIDEFTRIAQVAAEGVDLVVNTDHDRIYDSQPDVVKIHAEHTVHGVRGIEISPLYGHMNAYPVDDTNADRKAAWPVSWWVTDEDGEVTGPRMPTDIFADLRAKLAAKVIQLNHPREGSGILNFADYDPTVGFSGVSPDLMNTEFDAVEIQNSGYDSTDEETLHDWFSFLNQGLRKTGVGVSDSHGLGTMIGIARTLVAVPDDTITADYDVDTLLDNLKAQHAVKVCGPFVELWALDGQGGTAAMGDTITRTSAAGDLRVRVRIQAPPFVQTARLILVVNGGDEVIMDLPDPGSPPAAVRLDQEIDIPWDGGDAWIVAIVQGDQPMWPLTSQKANSVTNPVYVDRDGDGTWTAPGL